jgi:hypothetical protein
MARHAALSSSAPYLRKLVAAILTDMGWLQGTFHVPEQQALLDYLTGGVQLLKATRVRFPGEKEPFPFVALRRDAITVIEPSLDELIVAPGSVGRTTPHRVSCFLPVGLLHATLEVLINVRVSDFLRQQPGLLVLRDCVLAPYGSAADDPKARRMRVVILNLSRTLGIAEREEPT